MSKNKKTKTIKVDYLARVEGEADLAIEIENNKITDVKLKIFEPPRFFEALLEGRDFAEAPDITSRICGICPVTYLMSACHAMESLSEVKLPNSIRHLRRLLYCGEWIKSHSLHIFMLHLPDFMGTPDAMVLAKTHPELIQNGLKLKKLGNTIMDIVGGRDVHPVNVKVGGFYAWPEAQKLNKLIKELEWGVEFCQESIDWIKTFDFPEHSIDYDFIGLVHPDEYPFNEGDIHTSNGLKFSVQDFENYIIESQMDYSTTKHANLTNKQPILAGPMARLGLNFEKLTPLAKQTAKKLNLIKNNNPFKSILVRLVEVLYCCEHAIELIKNYKPTGESYKEIKITQGQGFGCTEAPRGICYHRYETDEKNKITKANIVPPTTINQHYMEKDLMQFLPGMLNKKEIELQHMAEKLIRNYDPCISCATHFLNLKVNRYAS